MTISEPLLPLGFPPMESALKSLAGASRARTSALRGRELAWPAPGRACGLNTHVSLASYDPVTSLWRTSQLCLDGGLSEYSETWPRSGMMRNGTAYLLPPLVRLTGETESGLWPTPTAQNAKHTTLSSAEEARARRGIAGLHAMVVWRTPQARDGMERGPSDPQRRMEQGHSVSLQDQVGGALNPTWVEWLMGFPLGWTDCGG